MSDNYKRVKALAFSLALLMATGCTNSSQPVQEEKVNFIKEDLSKITTINELEKVSQEAYLENSVALPKYEGYTFDPRVFTDNGYAFGQFDKEGTSNVKYFGYLNVNDQSYKLVSQLEETEFTSVGVLAANEDYVIVRETISQNVNNTNISVYDIKKDSFKTIYEIKDTYLLLMNASIYENYSYIAYPTDGVYRIYEYDIKSGKSQTITDSNSDSPVRIGDDLYYMSYENEPIRSSIHVMNMKNKEVKSVLTLDHSKNEGIVDRMIGDGKNLYLFSHYGTVSFCYKYDIEKKEVRSVFREDKVENPRINGEFMIWSEIGSMPARKHPKEYLYHLENSKMYEFADSFVLPSKKGFVWSKYLIDEREIPKGELGKYTQLMYKAF